MEKNRRKFKRMLCMLLAVMLLVTSITFSGFTSERTFATIAYYPTLSFNLGNLSSPNSWVGKLTNDDKNAQMCSIYISGSPVFCMQLNGSLSRYNAFYAADIDNYGKSYQKYFRGAVYYYEDENDEFTLSTTERYVVSQIILWRILQIRKNGKSGTYNNIMNGFESTFKSIINYWGECNANTAWNEIDKVMKWVNNGEIKVGSDYVTLYLWTHADGTQPLLKGTVKSAPEEKAYIAVQKEGEIENAIVKDAKFGIYSNNSCKEAQKICTLTTDKYGYAITTKAQAKKLKHSTTYYIKEIQAPAGSEINETVYEVKTSAKTTKNQAVKLTVVDKQYKIKIKTIKIDEHDEEIRLTGAKFRVYQWNASSKRYEKYKDYTTGTNGEFITEWLYYTKSNGGKYRIKEIKAPTGYALTTYKQDIQINKNNNGNTVKYKVKNKQEQKPGWIEIYKKAFVGNKNISSEIDLTATFTIYSDAACTKIVDTIVTNGSTGYGKSGELNAGIYYVKETKWGESKPTFKGAQAVTVIQNHTKTIYGEVGKLAGQWADSIGIKIKKVDAYDNNNLGGAEFGIYEWNGISWTLKYKEKTNAEGIIEIPADDNKLYYTKLNQGKFKIVELSTPAGYILDSTPKYITITETNANTTVDLGVFKNSPIGGHLEIQKIIVDVDNNKIVNMPMNSSLLNITYGLYRDVACTDVVDDNIKLDTNGKARKEDLRAATYYLKETTANRSIFAATSTLNTRIIPVTINMGKTTIVDGELGYSEDGGDTWNDCWSDVGTMASLTNRMTTSAVDVLLSSNKPNSDTVFGNSDYTIASEYSENKTKIGDISDNWKNYSDKELDEIIGNSEDKDIADFLINLSNEDLNLILSKKTCLTKTYTTYALENKETGELKAISEEIYWKYLMELPYQGMPMSTLNGKTGYFNIVINGNGVTSNVKVTVKVSGTNTTGKSVVATMSISGTNNHNIRLLNTSTNTSMAGQESASDTGNYNILQVSFTYTNPKHYYATGTASNFYTSHQCKWSNCPKHVEGTATASLEMNLTNAGLRTINGNTYHATMTLTLNKCYSGLEVNPNGGSWKDGSTTFTSTTGPYWSYVCESTKSIANPTKEGYSFNGWSVTNSTYSYGKLSGNVYGENITSKNSTFTFCGLATGLWEGVSSGYYTTLTANWKVNQYNVTCIDVVGTSSNGKELGRSTFKADYNSVAYGSINGSSTVLGAYYTGYYYSGCSSAKVGASGTTVYRYFTKTPIPENAPNVLKNVLKMIEFDIIKKDAEDNTKTLDATFDVLEWSNTQQMYVPYLTNVKSHTRVNLRLTLDNFGKYKVVEKSVQSDYKMSGASVNVSIYDKGAKSIPYYENLLGVDEDLGVFVIGRGYNAGDIVRNNAETDSATWYRCLVANMDKEITNTTYWKKVTSSNYNRYNDLVNGAGVWNEKLDVITVMAVEVLNKKVPSPGTTDILINKENRNGDILYGAKFIAYYTDGTKCIEFDNKNNTSQYTAIGINISDKQTHSTYDTSTGIRTLNLVIKEEKAPFGYAKTDDINVTIKSQLDTSTNKWKVISSIATFSDGTTQDITSGIALTVVDEDIKLNLYINKKSCDSSLPISTLEGAVFGIYDNEECTSLITELVIGKNGNAAIERLTLKDYWIKEISTPTSGLYKLSDEVKHIDASQLYDGTEDVTVVNAYTTFIEEPILGEILIKKFGYTDLTYTQTNTLKDAGFTLYALPEIPENADENEYVLSYDFTNKTPIKAEVKTDGQGIARFKDLSLGDYVIVETTVPKGYIKSENKVVHLTEEYVGNTDETAYPVIIYNEPDNAPIRIYKVNASNKDEYLEGAVFKIYDVNAGGYIADTVYTTDESGNENSSVETKLYTTDENGLITTERLKYGTYRIEEVSAPIGFRLNETPVEVVIGEGMESGLDENGYPYYEIIIEDEPTDTYFVKADISTKEEIEGGHYTVLDSLGNVIDEWDGTGTAHHIYGLISGEIYTFTEETAPDGYVVAEDVTFTINEDGTPTKVIMYDDYNKVQISKQDLTTGEELPGATLQIIGENGNVIEEWVSTNEPHLINRLAVGIYTLRETIAPDGYIVSEDIEFTVGESSEIQKVVMYDDYTKTAFIKLAEDTLGPLAGCVLQVLDKYGKVVDEWTTDGEIHYIYKLTKGATYTLHEVLSPDGYEIAEDIKFVVGEEYVSKEEKILQDMEIVDKEGIGIEDDSHIKEEEDTPVSMDEDSVIGTNKASGLEEDSYTEIIDIPEIEEEEVFNASEPIIVTMTDSPLEIVPEKVDENGNPVYGAVMQLIDKDGKVIYEWETGLMQTQGFKVKSGTYTLHEVSAPIGYQLAENKEVTVTNKDVSVKVIDRHTNIKLPHTGGTTMNIHIFAGSLILIGGTLYFGKKRKLIKRRINNKI